MSDELARDDHWQRLDPRMLLVHPIRELVRFLPVLIGIFVAGTAAGGGDAPWHLVGVGVPVGLGVLRYLTTSFRITAGRVELRRGLLNRHVLSTRLDRVRTVDLTSSPIHRVLGLTTVRIGTGTSSTDEEDRLDLDGLPIGRARDLRLALLHVATGADTASPEEAPRERIVVRFDPSWLRFAPFTSSGLVIAAAAIGATSQGVNALGGWDRINLGGVVDTTSRLSPWVALPLGVVVFVVLVSLLSVGGYVVTNFGFTLSHAAGAWHLHRGLLTTRETSLDDERVAGVSVCEPLGLRAVGGGRVAAIVTGLDRKQQGSSVLVPPAPRDVVREVARQVIGRTAPIDAPLVGHGPRARTRRYSRALLPALTLVATAGVLVATAGAPWWLLVVSLAAPALAVPLAADRAAGLGHTLVDGYVVAQSGSLNRHRRALATEDVIGWNFRATWFQRRAGLTSLVATTAGGDQAVPLLDVPEDVAVDLAEAALPDLVAQFRA
ncbi:putative membrane protein [Nocardioides ginsengisegetis]|uniref:Putative membrane protein n=1 Tax=Nocardioides ginsengisegetis TaxID=661491 RepID=A0A7W3IX67_9ACTN|nr:putative membrane protein [Nocardioides ginsengisegetis]